MFNFLKRKKLAEKIDNTIDKIMEATDSDYNEWNEIYKEWERVDDLYAQTGDTKYVNQLFELSAELARLSGVPENEILKSQDELDSYFLS